MDDSVENLCVEEWSYPKISDSGHQDTLWLENLHVLNSFFIFFFVCICFLLVFHKPEILKKCY